MRIISKIVITVILVLDNMLCQPVCNDEDLTTSR